MKKQLIYCATSYACGGMVVKDGIITEAPPIFKWCVGKTTDEVSKWSKWEIFQVDDYEA